MRLLAAVLLLAPLAAPVQAGGFLARLFSRGNSEKSDAPQTSAKLLELEILHRPLRPIAGEFARVQFRVRQLVNPDPQFVAPSLCIRRYSSAGTQLQTQCLKPNGEGIYEASVSMTEARLQYLYFETSTEAAVLAKVPWVVLRSAD